LLVEASFFNGLQYATARGLPDAVTVTGK